MWRLSLFTEYLITYIHILVLALINHRELSCSKIRRPMLTRYYNRKFLFINNISIEYTKAKKNRLLPCRHKQRLLENMNDLLNYKNLSIKI